MILRASSASLACTEMRTSPSSFTLSGNTEWVTADETIDRRSCASSRPRTIVASTSEWVRKITTRSDTSPVHDTSPEPPNLSGLGRHQVRRSVHVLDLQQNHRHVVVLGSGADERLDLPEHALAQLVGRQVRVGLDQAAQ